MASSNDAELWQLNGHALFDKLQIEMKSRIPSSLRKILMLNDIDSVVVLAHLNDVDKKEIENFIKNDLISEMLNTGETMKDYLGVYEKCQTLFQFSAEQHSLIDIMVECSKRLWPIRKDSRDSVGRTDGNKSGRDSTRNDQQQPKFSKDQHIGKRHDFQHVRITIQIGLRNDNQFIAILFRVVITNLLSR